MEKFKNEVRNHFNLDNLIAYYLITELFGMVDQRAKNMFLTYFHEEGKWIFIFYDNDTCFGLNNEGLIAFGYNIEYHDKIGTLNVWNGESSVLWNNLEKCFPSEIEAMYKDIRTRGLLSYDLIMSVLNGEQSDKWCEAIYNADGRFKYIDPLIEEGNGSYLYAAQGSRIENRKWWTYNRFLYIDSKYTAGSFLSDFATLRLYTPREWTGVSPSANMTIIPYADQYTRVKYGSYMVGQRTYKDVPVLIEAPDIVFNDTETIIYGASRVKSLGDMSGLYAGTIDVSKATRLSELLIGSGMSGYQNTNLTVLSIGTNNMLRKLDIRNCPNLRQAVDISGCENMEEVYAQGTSITSVVLPAAGILSKLYLPATLTGLTLRNQSKLTDAYFEIAGVERLTTIVCEDTGINVFYLISRCLGIKNPVLNRIRLIDINASAPNLNDLYKLIRIGGIDENGNNVQTAVITGKFHAISATSDKLAKCRAAFPELEITYTTLLPPTITTFVFRSSQSKTITNAVFECGDYEYEKVNEYTYKVTADDDSVIPIVFKCDNHKDFTADYLVSGTRTQDYTITYIPLRTIRVKVYGQSVYLSGAMITTDTKSYTTDANGYVYIRGGEAMKGTVSALGYGSNTFDFPAITNDTSHTLDVYAVVDVKFVVKGQFGAIVTGATVTCDGKSKETNLYGECILQLTKGSYDYEVIHPDHYDAKGPVNVGTSAMSVNVYMNINPIAIKPEENGNIQMMLTGPSCSISVKSTTADYIIDWGDGMTENASGTGSKSYPHTYGDDGLYQVEVRNCGDVTSCMASTSCLVAYWSIGESKVYDITFSGCYYLIYFGKDVFKNDINRTSANYLLYNCNKLTSVDLTPLSGWVNVTSAYSLLSGCYGLTSVDLTPLSGWVNVTNAGVLLNGCYNLTSVDLTPLSGWVNVTNAYGLLSGCDKLTSVDLTPLSGWVNVTNADSLLNGCYGLTSVDLTPLSGWVNVTNADRLLNGCYGLTSVDLTPLSYWTKMMNNSGLISSCGSLAFVSVLSTTPFPLSSGALTNGNSCPIYVPDDAVDTYKTATNWSAYASRIKPISEKAS